MKILHVPTGQILYWRKLKLRIDEVNKEYKECYILRTKLPRASHIAIEYTYDIDTQTYNKIVEPNALCYICVSDVGNFDACSEENKNFYLELELID